MDSCTGERRGPHRSETLLQGQSIRKVVIFFTTWPCHACRTYWAAPSAHPPIWCPLIVWSVAWYVSSALSLHLSSSSVCAYLSNRDHWVWPVAYILNCLISIWHQHSEKFGQMYIEPNLFLGRIRNVRAILQPGCYTLNTSILPLATLFLLSVLCCMSDCTQ
jgi:hypothetical protein